MTEPQTMSASATTSPTATAGLVEKAPLERYQPPAKPSLVGLSRAQLTEALASIGVPAVQRKMRVQQTWHWLYVRGARPAFHARAPRNRGRAGLCGRHAKMAPALARRALARPAARDRMRLYPGGGPRHALPLQSGRLYARLLILPHRHAAARAQPHARRDRRPDHGGARLPRRLAWSGAPGRLPCRIRGQSGGEGRPASHLEHGDDGHGRAALQ